MDIVKETEKLLEEMKRKNGHVRYDGREYILLQQAYADGPIDEPVYRAAAICTADRPFMLGCQNSYMITWTPTEEFLAYADECAADGSFLDEGDACDWDNPESVEEYDTYNLRDAVYEKLRNAKQRALYLENSPTAPAKTDWEQEVSAEKADAPGKTSEPKRAKKEADLMR